MYVVFNDERFYRNGYKRITKVGREYAYYEDREFRIRLSDMAIEIPKYGTRGNVYKSEEHYKRHKELKRKRKAVAENIHTLTDEQVDTVFGWLQSAGVTDRFECHININKNFN